MIKKIISGGQTGADQGGLEAGKILGIETGGWTPLGWRTENGPMPNLGSDFGLKEHSDRAYPPRTAANVRDSDGTVIFGDITEPGSSLTVGLCKNADKHFFVVDRLNNPSVEVQAIFLIWLDQFNIQVLNVAGNRESKNPGIQRKVREFLVQALGRDFKHGDLVRYIPNHAKWGPTHPDCKDGVVSSVTKNWVFVKYNCLACTMVTGDEPYTAQATDRENLVRR